MKHLLNLHFARTMQFFHSKQIFIIYKGTVLIIFTEWKFKKKVKEEMINKRKNKYIFRTKTKIFRQQKARKFLSYLLCTPPPPFFFFLPILVSINTISREETLNNLDMPKSIDLNNKHNPFNRIHEEGRYLLLQNVLLTFIFNVNKDCALG